MTRPSQNDARRKSQKISFTGKTPSEKMAMGQRSLVYQSLNFPNERDPGPLKNNGLADQKHLNSRNAAANAMLSNESKKHGS